MRRRSSNLGVVVAAISEEAAVEKKVAPAPAKTKARAALTVRRKSKEDFKDAIAGHLDSFADMIDQLELRKLKWEARHAVFVIFLLHFEQVFFVRTYV
ncbi:probable lipoxygenase 6 [Ananas comosus]|uniref:Probable lipoxygenase 6 n=1 Tax=Ananas comosus TaxID=4615 RepID=A0A6P5ENR6_ANACO|nr:probable lipoxygenase 6 [Ananas comosus]